MIMIFNLFKSKPTLKDLIPEGFVDIHSHILPGIDDGAKNIKESISLISKMKEMGFSKIIGTPHTYPGLFNNNNDTILESYNKIKNEISNISYASEYMIDRSLIKKAEDNELLCLKKKYVLIEQSFVSENLELYDIIFELKLMGYKPVLAHPERYFYYHDKFSNYYKLKNYGFSFQINLLSVVGYYGKNVAKISDKLLKNNLVDFTGSDFHSLKDCDQINNQVVINEKKKLEECMLNNNYFI